MSQTTILLACPTCKHTCRTHRETQPGAKFRCPGCHGMFYFFVHGNGAVVLRPADDEPVIESRLPPRVEEQGETQGTRKIFNSRRRNRPMGGYHAFEKSRSYIMSIAFFTVLGLALVAGSWYIRQVETLGNAQGRKGTNAMKLDVDAKRKAFQERQKRALENLKKQSTNVQPSGAKVEDGPRAGGWGLVFETPGRRTRQRAGVSKTRLKPPDE